MIITKNVPFTVNRTTFREPPRMFFLRDMPTPYYQHLAKNNHEKLGSTTEMEIFEQGTK